jgi:hypothetical protein
MHTKAIESSILSICPYSKLHFNVKFTCVCKGAHYLHDIKQYHTCLNTPCLPNKEMVVPPTGWILEGPTVS